LKRVARIPSATLLLDTPQRVTYPPFDICVVRTEHGVFAIEDACNHAGASLSEGPLQDGCIACPLHGYVFALASGELLRPKRLCDGQRTFVVRERDEHIDIYEREPIAMLLP
jgi:nitrite reductase/ring-hydroxylating ferredoxin subunit